MNRLHNVLLGCAAIFFFAGGIFAAEEAAETRDIAGILTAIEQNPSEPVWQAGAELSEIGKDKKEDLDKALAKATPRQKLALGYALLALNDHRTATTELIELIKNQKASMTTRIDAAALLGTNGSDFCDWHLNQLGKDETLPELLRVEVVKSLWKRTNGETAFTMLNDILEKSGSLSTQAEAAIALGRFGRFNLVASRLKDLARLPGKVGEEAQTLLDLEAQYVRETNSDSFPTKLISEIVEKVQKFAVDDTLEEEIDKELKRVAGTAGPRGEEARMLLGIAERINKQLQRKDFPTELIAEVMQNVRKRYDPDKTDAAEDEQLKTKALASAAASAMVSSIDQFNDYLDEASLQDMEEQMRSNYSGIGAYVGMRNGNFTIITPMYGRPAFNAGLLPRDVVEKIDGTDITKMDLNSIIKMLKGPADTSVAVTVWRSGWTESRDFSIVRKTIDLPSVETQTLPGNIGFIRLMSFSEGENDKGIKGTADLLEEALIKFKEAGVKGIVLDLTNNPGGLLLSAVEVCQKLLPPNELIVYSKGKQDVYPRRSYYTKNAGPVYSGPLVVMVNSGSASASEITAGALQDHKRAALVGEKTYGKGSVQQLIPLTTTHGLTRLKLTIAKYYLPSDRCIHGPDREEGGIKPDIDVKPRVPSRVEVDTRLKLRDERVIESWLEKNFEANKEKFRQLLEYDGFKSDDYPGFNDLMLDARTKLPDNKVEPEMVRKELRLALRQYFRNHLGENVPVDMEEDQILQHALVKLGELIPGGLPKLPLYNDIAAKVKEAQEKMLAEAEKVAIPMHKAEKEGGATE